MYARRVVLTVGRCAASGGGKRDGAGAVGVGLLHGLASGAGGGEGDGAGAVGVRLLHGLASGAGGGEGDGAGAVGVRLLHGLASGAGGGEGDGAGAVGVRLLHGLASGAGEGDGAGAVGVRLLHGLASGAGGGEGDGTGANSSSPLRRLLDGAATYGEGAGVAAGLQWATQPYAARPPGPAPPPPARPDPRDAVVVLFPGQGAQQVGMGRAVQHLPAARDLYELASETLKWDVLRVCTEGPAELLAERCQVCVLVTSLAALEAARDARPGALGRVRAAAGFSLGEITALVFAGALPLEGALRLLELRAAAMAAAAARRAAGAGLLTVWLAPDHRLAAALRAARDHAREGGVEDPLCEVANYLYPNCKVIAGDEAALAWLEARGGAWGVRRAARVAAAGPWHSRDMRAAGAAVRAALARLDVSAPRVRVVSNVDARAYGGPEHVRRQLARHVSAPVRWEQTLHALYARAPGERFPLTLALGPGRTLRATLKQVNAKAWDSSVQIDV